MRGTVVCKSNHLVQAGYRLSLNEQRILLACMAQFGSTKISEGQTFVVSVLDLERIAKVGKNGLYENLKQAADRLHSRKVTLTSRPDGERLKGVLVTSWVQSVYYLEDEGTIEVQFARAVLPYLTHLKNQFTKYSFEHVAQMRSAYGIRFYELVAQYRGIGKREVNMDWLRDSLQLGEDTYKRMPDLKRRVIEPALRDINDASDMWVKCEYRKTGRKTTHLLLTFGSKKVKLTKEYIEKNALPGESWEQATQRLRG